jgi:hypothetical protein
MNFTKDQETTIEHMITKGDKMEAIAQAIGKGCTWQDIQEYCWANGAMSWQGSKKMISNRLKRFRTTSRQEDREQLAGEIADAVNYLYNCAKQMRSRILEVEKALKKIK